MSRKFCSERTIRVPYATQRTTDPEDAAKKKFKFQKKIRSSEKNLGSAASMSESEPEKI
jgi:hypothetical protein